VGFFNSKTPASAVTDNGRCSDDQGLISTDATKQTPPRQAVHPADDLLVKINDAVKAANDAEQTVTTAQTELVSRCKQVGLLLLEAKKLHPKVADFEAFLKRVDGLKLSRAYDLLRLAGGRTTDTELKEDARQRKQKSRAKKKLPKPAPTPTPTPAPAPEKVSVTDPHVTESKRSAYALEQFKGACTHWLLRMNAAHRQEAIDHVASIGKARVV
jgi:hypothetical protein